MQAYFFSECKHTDELLDFYVLSNDLSTSNFVSFVPL